MSSFNFKITGGKELDRALSQFSLRVETNIAKSAARAGAAVVLKDARQRAPQDSGTLRRSLAIVARKSQRGEAVVASVVTRSGRKWNAKRANAWYAGKVEFGTATTNAQPFLRPALDSKRTEVIKAMATKIQARIAKYGLKV